MFLFCLSLHCLHHTIRNFLNYDGKIVIYLVELFIESHIVFVAFWLGTTRTALVISRKLILSVSLYPKWYLVTLVVTTSAVVIYTILLMLFNWVCIYVISVCICCIFCRSWGKICVEWMVALAIWNKVSSVSFCVCSKTLIRSSTTCFTICDDWKPASTIVSSSNILQFITSTAKCGLNAGQGFSYVSFLFHSRSHILYCPFLLIML